MKSINWSPIGGRNSRKDKKGKRASSTPGTSKSENCMASPLDKFFAKYARSVRYTGYQEWSEKKRG